MIEPDSKYHKSLPERYFSIPKSEKSVPNILLIQLERIDAIVDIFLRNDDHDINREKPWKLLLSWKV